MSKSLVTRVVLSKVPLWFVCTLKTRLKPPAWNHQLTYLVIYPSVCQIDR